MLEMPRGVCQMKNLLWYNEMDMMKEHGKNVVGSTYSEVRK